MQKWTIFHPAISGWERTSYIQWEDNDVCFVLDQDA
jgi:hypothetical protein